MRQCMHIMPSTLNVFSIAASFPFRPDAVHDLIAHERFFIA
jgi:hypothetical protein